jgi:CubicO group peptidase (beta-lactamase class C family)
VDPSEYDASWLRRAARPATLPRTRSSASLLPDPMSAHRLVLACALAICHLTFVEGLTAQERPLRGIERYIERAMRAWEVPGLSIAVVRNDSIVYARGFGVRQAGRHERVDEHTLFAVASTTKPMTATALGILVDEGRLHWDDPVVRHLPEFRLYDARAAEELTVRDLLAHRTGLPRGDLLWWSSPYSREEVVRRVRYLRPLWPIRTQFTYQNVMYIAAGELVESLAGTSWDEFLAERLFRPLSMDRTNTSTEALLASSNVATPHARVDGRVGAVAWRNFDNLGAAGAVNSSAWDMAQWVRLVLGNGAVGGWRIASDSVISELRTPQIAILADSSSRHLFPEVTARAYGLGWGLQEYRGRTMMQHDGALDGMRAQVTIVPEEGIGVVVIANLSPTNLHQAIALRVIDAYLGQPGRDWSRDLLAAARLRWNHSERHQRHRDRARIVGTEPSLALDRYQGIYLDSLYGEMVVERHSDGDLVLRFGHLWMGDLEHWHFNTFRVHWRDRSMGRSFATFTLSREGSIRSMSLEEFGDFGRAADAGGSGDASAEDPPMEARTDAEPPGLPHVRTPPNDPFTRVRDDCLLLLHDPDPVERTTRGPSDQRAPSDDLPSSVGEREDSDLSGRVQRAGDPLSVGRDRGELESGYRNLDHPKLVR